MNDNTSWHSEAFIQNRYTRYYRAVVERAQSENRSRVVGEHAEHHIVPESFFIARSRPGPPGWLPGDPDDPANLVLLTHKEHAWCHILLVERMTWGSGKDKMALAGTKVLGALKAAGKPYRLCSRLWASIMQGAAAASRNASMGAAKDQEIQRRKGEATRRARQNPAVMAKILDSRIRHWTHKDGRTFIGTRWQLEDLVGLPRSALKPLTRIKPAKTQHGWRITAETDDWLVIPEPPKTPRPAGRPEEIDTTFRVWKHRDGRTFAGTREELEKWAGLPYGRLKPLTKAVPRRFSGGWHIVDQPGGPPTWEQILLSYKRRRESTVRHWQHKDGRTFTGTRWQLEEWCGMPRGTLGKLGVTRASRRQVLGWRIVSGAAEKSENGQLGS